jgi:ribonuclease HI
LLRSDDDYLVYTDGSCYAADRIGSYAWVVIDGEGNEELQGSAVADTTISRMELMGAIRALEWILDSFGPSYILLYSDSEYVVKGITDRSRKRNKNVDLWLWLDEMVDAHEHVEFEHCRGHVGNYYNEMVDKLAGELRLGARVQADEEL